MSSGSLSITPEPANPAPLGSKTLPLSSQSYPLIRYIARRLGVAVILVFVVSVLIFGIAQLLPGNAALAILGRAGANPAALRNLELQLGLNQSALSQYLHWLGHLFTGNLGISYAAREPVTTLIGGKLGNTLILAGATLILLVPLSLVFGVIAGVLAGRRTDNIISGLTLSAIALPEFVTGTLLALLFAVWLHLLPAVSLVATGSSPLKTPSILVLPVVTLLIAGLAYNVRMIRAGVSQEMSSEYVEAARLNGIPEKRIIRKHVLRNALAPSIQTFALLTQWLVGGVVVVETVFQYPGIGQALVQAVSYQDAPVVLALGMIIATFYIVLNVVADVVVMLLVPKLRTEAR